MSRLLIISDSPGLYSGQARVVRELAPRLQKSYEVVVGGWFHALAEKREYPYKIFSIEKSNYEQEVRLIAAVKPDIVLALGDPWDFRGLVKVRLQGSFRLVGYLNIESQKIAPELEQVLDGFDNLVVSSTFGVSALGRPGVQAVRLGVNMETFYPMEGVKDAVGSFSGKAITVGEVEDRPLSETFVVLINGQNTGRKNLGTAIKAFGMFSHGKEDVLLYANTQMVPSPGRDPGLDLRRVITSYRCEDKVVFNPHQNRPDGVQGQLRTMPDKDMNAVYAVSDALLLTSVAEGFGLPVLEAMATKTVPIAPRAYTMPELIGRDRGITIPVSSTWFAEWGEVVMVDAPSMSHALQGIYDAWHEKKLGDIHNAGLAFAMTHSWDLTATKLMDAMAEPQAPKIATGAEIDPYLRVRVKGKIENEIGVLKVGGLGDMLQATAVIQALQDAYPGKRVTVFVNAHHEVFEDLDVEPVKPLIQDVLVRSVADQFELFADLRYVSRLYGTRPTDYFKKYQHFYSTWIQSCDRLLELDEHTTRIMLKSLGLVGDITPVFNKRAGAPPLEPGTYLTAATGVGMMGKLKKWSHWDELAAMMINRRELQINGAPVQLVQVGGKEDDRIDQAIDCRGLSLAETATIIEASAGFVGVEGGMAHLATAVGTHATVLFGPTSPVLFGYPQNTNLSTNACRPCWFSMPSWDMGKCPLGEPVCLNFHQPRQVELSLRGAAV